MHDSFSGRGRDTDGIFDSPELKFSRLITEFDAADSNLVMAYGRYMEKPSPRRMRDINKESESSFDAFGEIVQRVMNQGDDEVAGEDSRPIIFANILVAMSQNHSRLLAEYTDFVEVSDKDDARDETLLIAGVFEELDDDELAKAVLEHFAEIRDTSMEAIQRFIIERQESPTQRIKERAIRGSIDVAKIGTGVLLGLSVYDMIKR